MSNAKTLLLLTLTTLIILPSKGQFKRYSFNNNISFCKYLQKNGLKDECLLLIKKLSPQGTEQENEVNYLKGSIFFDKKMLDSSSFYYGMVSKQHDNFLKAKFYEAYNHIYLKNTDTALTLLNKIKITGDSLLVELKAFEKAGAYLMDYDIKAYNKEAKKFSGKYFSLLPHQQKLQELSLAIKHYKHKSPTLAAIMSAIIPGSGKLYAKKIGGGISSFLAVGILGFITYENYKKAGPKNFKTILFGSFCAIAYVGNIYGSYYSIKSYRDEFSHTMDYSIGYHLQIPLRNIFRN